METFTNTESQLSENTTKKSTSMIEQENPAFYQALAKGTDGKENPSDGNARGCRSLQYAHR